MQQPLNLSESLNDFRIIEVVDTVVSYTVLSFTHHHLVADGYSIDLMLKDYFAFYAINKSIDLTDDSYSYADVAELITLRKADKGFVQSICPQSPHFTLPGDSNKANSSAEYQLIFSNEEKLVIRNLAQKYNTTINAIMLSGLYFALYRFTGESHVNLGIVFSNRDNPVTENVVGCLINALPLEISFSMDETKQSVDSFILDFVARLNSYMQYGSYPLQNVLEIARSLSDQKLDTLFRIVFASQHINHLSGNMVKMMPSNKRAKFDVSFNFYHTLDAESLDIEFNTDKYTKDYITGFCDALKSILYGMETNSDKSISNISILNSVTYQQIIYDWNETAKKYPSSKTIVELFEAQVAKTPDNIALVYADVKLNYTELNACANQLAIYLRVTYQIKGDDLIALCLNRSEYMLIAILGVLKSGGAYVPLDPGYPDERISYVLEDTKAHVLITNTVHKERFSTLITAQAKTKPQAVLAIDSQELASSLSKQSTQNLPLNITSDNLAYVIYTSGTTGKPKGVMIEHKSVMNLCTEFIHTHQLDQHNEVAIYSNYVFDAFVYEVIPAIVNGNQLFLLDEEIRLSLANLGTFLQHNQIKIMFVPTILLKEFLRILHQNNPLRLIYTGGEKLPILDSQYVRSNLTILNEYGPTESTVCSTFKCYSPDTLNTNIGRPVANITTYVLDVNLQPLPPGVIGELYIGGESLGRGYFNHPELTAERFIPNPFQSDNDKKFGRNSRIYKTGDLVRYLANGDIDYIGRNDFQVKIRGFRIELSEIEAVLNRYSDLSNPIKQSVVLAVDYKNADGVPNGNKYLVAYYVAENELPQEKLLNHLSANLPEYMVPSILVYLTKLPQTINGKLDVKALPEAVFKFDSIYVAPKNQLETKVCSIYALALGLDADTVGMNDDFFKLGGNSILAIKVVNQLNTCTAIKVSVADFFRYKTIHELILQGGSAAPIATIPCVSYSDTEVTSGLDQYSSLSFAQERLWFFEKYVGGSYAYNIPVLYTLNSEINLLALKQALISTVSRHEVLYSLIQTDFNGQGFLVAHDLAIKPLCIVEHDVSNEDELQRMVSLDAYHVYDLANEYPIRISLYTMLSKPEKYFLSIVVHHIAFDGWSMDVFLRDLHAYYAMYLNGGNVDLPRLDIKYKDFAVWQKNYLSGTHLEQQLNYWENKLSGYTDLNLLTDFPRPAVVGHDGDNLHFTLDLNTSKQLRELARSLSVSLYGVLLSGFYLFLRSYTNSDDIVVGSPIANRNYSQLENLIGFFVNTVGLRSYIDKEQKLREYICRVGYDVLEAQVYQEAPFEKVVNCLNIPKDQSRHPLFQILFGVQDFGSVSNVMADLFVGSDSVNGVFTGYKVAKFDLTVMIDDFADSLTGVFNYATSLYNKTTIQNFIDTYVMILQQLPEKIEQPLKQINYLTSMTYQDIVYRRNDNSVDYPRNKTLFQLFEEQVIRTPDNIAVVFGDVRLSYNELNQQANKLASYLRDTYKIVENDLVVLFLNRSELIPIAILAVLKAGAAYVPLDPEIPDERINYVLQDTRANVLLTNYAYKDRLGKLAGYHSLSDHNYKFTQSTLQNSQYILAIDSDELVTQLSKQPIANLQLNNISNSLAYVIYTSGTTGNPKGVLHTHQSLLNGVLNEVRSGVINSQSHVLGKTAYAYDPSVREMFLPLLIGASLYLANTEIIRNNALLLEYITVNSIDLLIFAPSHLNVFISDLEDKEDYTSLSGRNLFTCGELLNQQLCDKLVSEFNLTVYAQYGVSELSQVLYTNKNSREGHRFYISANNKAYIIDDDLNPVPIGAIGELHLSGDGLALGYLNLPDLTKEKFIANLFQTEVEKANGINSRLCKTGDLVRYLADGSIEYFGRNDFQVKVRGFRVELGEIESCLLNYPSVKQAVVLAKEHISSNGLVIKYLVAYYVAKNKIAEQDLLSYLTQYLPEYMLPGIFMHLKEFPVTINGKLNRRALPEAEFVNNDKYIAPTTELERKLCSIFAAVLVLDASQIGVHDDFFRIGGNSILSIRLVSKLNNIFLCRLKVAEIFSAKCIENIAKLLNRSVVVNYRTLVELNSAKVKSELFMLHPAGGGCEVYSSIADKLNGHYQCYGIDNYNLHHEVKYSNLGTLSAYYLSVMRDQGRLLHSDERVVMFGWCLGGLFALEIAAQLEAEGYTNLDLYLLDTVILDEKLHKITANVDRETIKKTIRETLINKYEKDYVEKIINNFDTENSFGKEKISRKLNATKIYLYKAMQKDTRIQMDLIDAVFSQVKATKYNNLDTVVVNADEQIRLFTLEDVHHGNILEQNIVIEHLITNTLN